MLAHAARRAPGGQGSARSRSAKYRLPRARASAATARTPAPPANASRSARSLSKTASRAANAPIAIAARIAVMRASEAVRRMSGGGVSPPSLTPMSLPAVGPAAAAAIPAAASAAAAAALVAPWPLLALGPVRGCGLGALDQLLRLDEPAVLVLRDQLEADPAALLVDLLNDDVQDISAVDHVLDPGDSAGADVRDVQQPVGALLELDERAEVGRLDDLSRVGVADLGLLRQRTDRLDRRRGLRALGRVDEHRAVLLDVDLDVEVRLDRADRLAALADHEPDLVGVDRDRRDTRRVLGELAARLRNRREHAVEDVLTRRLCLRERVREDLARDTGDLDVHLQGGHAVARARDLEVHVAQMVLRALDVG